MKKLNKILFAVMMLLALGSQAQNSNNPWALSIGVNAVDTRTSAGGGKNWADRHFSQMFNVSDNWNILPSVSYIGVSKNIGKNLSVGLQGSINKITKVVYFRPFDVDGVPTVGANDAGYVVDATDMMYYGVDANLRYSFMSFIKSKVIDPSFRLGAGYTWFGDHSYATVNAGPGLTFWFTQNIGLSLESTYKWATNKTGDNRQDLGTGELLTPSHFQHTAGIVFQFGGKDTDGDGIDDKDDACPDVAGLKQFNGCPDTDGDGIIDSEDACPNDFGTAALKGCPDTDGDGIADKDDACPDVAGLAQFNGCPDTDGDGIADKDDKCPTEAGPASNGGCPFLDADKDGVADKDDDCPTVAGPASNRGCPEVTKEALDNLKVQARAIYFNTGKSTFKTGDKETPARLEAIKEIVRTYPNAKFNIEGHTDSTGSEVKNQKLSEERANTVREALIEGGVNANNLTSKGFGSSVPVSTNKTAAGRAENRRTEIKHVGSTNEGKL